MSLFFSRGEEGFDPQPITSWEDRSNLIVAHSQKTMGKLLGNMDASARVKVAEDCFRLFGIFERLEKGTSDWKEVSGPDSTLSAIHGGLEDLLWVEKVSLDDVRTIAEALKTNSSVLGIRFYGGCEIGTEGVRYISEMLKENSTLLFLNLIKSDINPEGARHISDMLEHNSTLLYLNIAYNHIGPEGAKYFSDALKNNSSLLHLNIGWNEIGIDGATYLYPMLVNNSSLLELNVESNELLEGSARGLFSALQTNSTLLLLDTQGNELSNFTYSMLIQDTLQKNSSLLYLGIGRLSNRRCACFQCSGEEFWDSMAGRRYYRGVFSSFHERRSYLESVIGVSSWTSVRAARLPLNQNQLPPEIWGEILGFISEDLSILKESFLVGDLRSGFLDPYPLTSFSSRDIGLLSMIPLIEGHFQYDRWTSERLQRLGVYGYYHTYSTFVSSIFSMNMMSNSPEDGYDSNDPLDSGLPLKRAKRSFES